MNGKPQRLSRLVRDTSISSDTSTASDMSTFSTTDSEAPLVSSGDGACQKPHNTRNRGLALAVGLCMCVSVGSLCVSLLLYTGVLQPNTHPTAPHQVVCLPCMDIVTTPFPEQDDNIHLLDRHFENRTMICCAKTPRQFSILFDKLLERKMKKKEVIAARREESRNQAAGPKSADTVGAHLLAGLQKTVSTETQVRSWLADRPLSFMHGLHLHADRLVVEHSGLYLVYSQVYFKVNMDDPSIQSHPPSLLGHLVHRYSVTIPNGGREDLLQAAHSCCGDDGDSLFLHTSHVMGVFQLSSRDEIYVTVSHPGLIYRDPTRSFLGVFKLN
ncbi:tumor necrosis factor ligand superfamily member 10-like [Haliotis rufescens]|uniref:tumor necrosis factor ligand superfamily member 10-like n=1 Tax=Haliotis rufescens TaxID=6454 RepID=UPI00201F2318|nr:tumor necrosis factor ligand superfamily member 10-like [Haliotis rufescens]XP_046337980.2 tumor necrosis factor ligand superfamily member 10-like [Haliotis rufescens]